MRKVKPTDVLFEAVNKRHSQYYRVLLYQLLQAVALPRGQKKLPDKSVDALNAKLLQL